jgi:hypothetical protein
MRKTMFSRAAARCAAALAAAIGVLALLPGGAAASTVVKTSFSGQDASAYWLWESANCVQSSASVNAHDGQAKDELTGHTSSSLASVVLGFFNHCDGTAGFAYAIWEPAPDDFKVAPNLGSASLNATVQVTDAQTGQTRPVQVNLTWSATDKAYTTSLRQRVTFPDGTKQTLRMDGAIRTAVATGTILDGTFDWTGGRPPDFAALVETKQGSLTITR